MTEWKKSSVIFCEKNCMKAQFQITSFALVIRKGDRAKFGKSGCLTTTMMCHKLSEAKVVHYISEKIITGGWVSC